MENSSIGGERKNLSETKVYRPSGILGEYKTTLKCFFLRTIQLVLAFSWKFFILDMFNKYITGHFKTRN